MLWVLIKCGALFLAALFVLGEVPIRHYDPASVWTWLIPAGLAAGLFVYDLLTGYCPHCGANFALKRETTRSEIIATRPSILKYACLHCGEETYRDAPAYGGNGGGGGSGGC